YIIFPVNGEKWLTETFQSLWMYKLPLPVEEFPGYSTLTPCLRLAKFYNVLVVSTFGIDSKSLVALKNLFQPFIPFSRNVSISSSHKLFFPYSIYIYIYINYTCI
ncbi:hypothetical protein OTU49_003501, partial [Cherax quadricarinatus]